MASKTGAARGKTAAPPRKKTVKAQHAEPIIERGLSISTPLVFISHDTRDADIAEAFCNLLTDASGGVLQSFRSSDRKGTSGIEFGAEWYSAIMSKLGEATDVVALLTQHSLDRPWILYEAGVARGKLDTPTLGVALGIPLEKASSGPFAQFQNCADDEDSLTKLVTQLIKKNPAANPREEAVRLQVRVFCDRLKGLHESRGKAAASQAKQSDVSPARMFEEVKVLVRDLPARISHEVGSDRPYKRMRYRKLHPGMLHELIHHALLDEDRRSITSALLIAFSLFKEDFPWAYELGKEFAMTFGRPPASSSMSRVAWRRLLSACEMALKSPLGFELRKDDGEALYVLTKFVHGLEEILPLGRSGSADEKTI